MAVPAIPPFKTHTQALTKMPRMPDCKISCPLSPLENSATYSVLRKFLTYLQVHMHMHSIRRCSSLVVCLHWQDATLTG